MRRSVAPSQLQGNPLKKPRFIPPGRSNPSPNEEITKLSPDVKLFEVAANKSQNDSRTCSLSLLHTKENPREINHGDNYSGKYCSEASAMPTLDPPHTAHSAPTELTLSKAKEEEPNNVVKYFSVVWCKASKKKHKKWEGDAVLIVKGRSLTLKDLEGKDIGKGIGYKFKDLEKIDEGQTLMIGGKEIEIMGIISSDDFNSGKCFQLGGGSPAVSSSSQVAKKCFSNPFKNVCKPNSKENIQNDFQNCKPRYDPYAPNSLVMPRPNKNHQWIANKNCCPLVDVVIDPHLVCHLRPHQKGGVIFLYECVMGMRVDGRCGAILADEMGLGKTLQCISLIWTLQCQGPYGGKPVIKKTLIVTPGSLVNNWRKEFQKWLGSERIKIFTVDQDHKVEEFIRSPLYSVLIISYEMLLRSLDQIKNIRFDLLICDEGHRLKNSAIKTTTALISLSCEKRIILTGTPVQNDLQEFFALIDFVNPGILGSLSSYRKVYEEPIIISREPSASEEEKNLGVRRAAELTRLTGLFILRRTQEVINKYLPPKIENVVFCQPGALQIELYRKLLNSKAVRFCLQGLLENSPHLICIGALKKLCNHPCLLFRSIKEKECSPTCDENEERSLYEGLINVFPDDYNPLMFTEKESGKLQVLSKLLEVIQELRPSEKVVLVSNYTKTLDILQEVCKRHGYAHTRLDGQTPISQRQHIVDGFNSKYSSDFIFLLSSKAGGVGLNLIGGSHLILYDIDWNPATDIQAMSRVWRDGQKHPVHIYRLLTTGTIEEKIYQRQISKQGLSGAVMDLTKTSEHIQFSVEELKNLFTLHESSHCATHDLLDCDCTGEKDHTDGSLGKLSISRNCQLGLHPQKSNSLKPLSMSQLKQWKHFSADHLNLPDPFLERIRENVSFFFQNITNQATAV
ncbi:DNA repair and recombination protein RAD54B isoform X1 [Elephas maximus indicus]|uniref:DNA repair and recombination protein RAD54B isoform X1 n=2 Tax=Elephas maximus indicus TaxID=99487 RepID=UPI002116172B|nr:DNA repair and recombination protein RAD54B isoform X1 [Elephas maximus indicus]XP_049709972.1 DNA repair and recombination protein RAD54B isoform X1 [Elephas maximus indicus]